ncbi:MAG: GNAT family N-acetyltransferase [Chloroflexi bacterium]|nr:GNAT family N-acetyltransferase [Chloroflexota bacterium]
MADRHRATSFIFDRWGADVVVVHGEVYQPAQLPGFVAEWEGRWCGLVTYRIEEAECEIVTLDSAEPRQGIGTALLAAVEGAARMTGCLRLWLMTTNDNLGALRFYQRRGFALVAVHRNAVGRARRLKPAIPHIGDYGIPLRDEIELEKLLT